MTKRKILVQLDSDKHASVFDRVAAIDAGVDELFSYHNVDTDDVEGLIHGAIFTRGPGDLKSTAIFIGGRNVARGEEMLATVRRTFFGPLRCSVMLDSNGANTTAAAAVIAASRHLDFHHTHALVLGATGPVGQRVGLLLAQHGAKVWMGSRSKDRAADVCATIQEKHPSAQLDPIAADDSLQLPDTLHLVVAAGAAGVRLLNRQQIARCKEMKVLVDLNAVPPTGIEGVETPDKGREENGIYSYGAIGVGGSKMKIHKAAVARLFESNDQILDCEQIFELGLRMENSR